MKTLLTLRKAHRTSDDAPTPTLRAKGADRFFVVLDPANSMSWRHDTYELAKEEADRLKSATPDREFVIYKANRVGCGEFSKPAD